MKKILIGLFAFCVIYAAASVYTGVQIKNSFDKSVGELNNQLHLQGLDLHVVEYKRGLFTSTIEMNLGPAVPSFSDADEKVGLNTETKIFHGPILYIYDFGIGQFSSKTKLVPKTKYSSFNKEYTKFFGDSLGKLLVTSYFGKTYKVQWKMDAVNFSEGAEKVAIEKSFLNLKGDLNANRIQGNFELGAMHWDLNTSEHLEMNSSPLTANFDFTKIEDAFSIGSVDIGLDKISVKKNGIPVEIQKAAISSNSKIVGKGVDTAVKFSVANIQGPIAAKNIYYNLEFNQISVAALKHLAEVQKKMAAESPTSIDSQKMALASIAQVLPEFLQPGLGLKVAIGGNYNNEDIKFSINSLYHPLPKGMTLENLTTPKDYLMLIDADFHAQIPKSLDTNGVFAPYVGTRLTETEKDYLIDAQFKDAQLKVGNEEVETGEFMSQFFEGFAKMRN